MIFDNKNFFLFKKVTLFKFFIISSWLGVSISYSDFYLFHLFLLFTSIIWIIQLKENEYKVDLLLFKKNYTLPFFILFAWYVFSLLWTPNIYLGLKYIFYLFCGICICFNVLFFSKKIKNLNSVFNVLSILVIVEIIISLIESFSNFRMPISSYSSIAGLFGKTLVNHSQIDPILNYSNIKPPTGFRWNTNDLAICMVISLPFFLCSKKTFVKIFGILAISSIVIMTASRAAFFGLLLIFSLYFLLIKKRAGTLALISIVSFIFIFGMIRLEDSPNPRINDLANTISTAILYLSGEIDFDGSLQWRRKLVENGLVALSNTYGIGLGAGGSVANQEIIGPVAGRFTSMHNFWIELIVEGGIVSGVLIYTWILLVIYKLFFITKSINRDLSYYSKCLFLSIIAFLPSSVAASSTIYFFPMWIMFGFAIAVIFLSETINIVDS